MGESFFSSAWREKIKGLKKYFSRVTGSFVATSAWTAVQYVGHRVCETLKYEWPSGGNPFEPPTVYPFNLVMALSLALAPLLLTWWSA